MYASEAPTRGLPHRFPTTDHVHLGLAWTDNQIDFMITHVIGALTFFIYSFFNFRSMAFSSNVKAAVMMADYDESAGALEVCCSDTMHGQSCEWAAQQGYCNPQMYAASLNGGLAPSGRQLSHVALPGNTASFFHLMMKNCPKTCIDNYGADIGVFVDEIALTTPQSFLVSLDLSNVL